MLLAGKKGLVLNVSNKHSIGWAIAERAREEGARVGVGVQNERFVDPVHKLLGGQEGYDMFMIDFGFEEQYAALRESVIERYKKIDFLVHSVGFAPKAAMEGRFLDTTIEDFQIAMNASAYSLIRLCKELEPLFNHDASIITLSYLGSTRIVSNYKVMGVCKAALEASVRYLASDLGDRGIRVNTVSPGPINTISGRGVRGISRMIDYVHDVAPLKRPYGQTEAAGAAVYLLSDLAKGVTSQIIFVDSGFNNLAV